MLSVVSGWCLAGGPATTGSVEQTKGSAQLGGTPARRPCLWLDILNIDGHVCDLLFVCVYTRVQDAVLSEEDGEKDVAEAEDWDSIPMGEGDGAAMEDYMDEQELIEDVSEPAAMETKEAAAEIEDYDEEEEEEQDGTAAHGGDVQKQTEQGETPIISIPDGADQATKASLLGIKLPVLGTGSDGESLLGFTDLFKSTIVGLPPAEEEKQRHLRTRKISKPTREDDSGPDDADVFLADRKALQKTEFGDNIYEDHGEEDEEDAFGQQEEEEEEKEKDSSGEMIGTATASERKKHITQGNDMKHEGGAREKEEAVQPERYSTGHRKEGDTGKDGVIHSYSFPEIPDYVYKPVYQRELHSMSLKHPMYSEGSEVVSEHETDSEVEMKEGIKSAKKEELSYNSLKISLGVEGSKLSFWNTQKEDVEKVQNDDGISLLGSNDILGNAPILRENVVDSENQTEEKAKIDLPSLIPRSTVWKFGKPEMVYDMNDPNLVFQETTEDTKGHTFLKKSAALIMQYSEPGKGFRNLDAIDDPRKLIQRTNISKDDIYFAPPKRRGTGRVGRTMFHTKFAALLYTIPLELDENQAIFWHRPRSKFVPFEKKVVRQDKDTVRIVFNTLFPRQSTRSVEVADPQETKIGNLWDYIITTAAFRDAMEISKQIKPTFFLPGNPPTPVPPDTVVADPLFARDKRLGINITVVYNDLDWFRTSIAEQIPEESSSALLRPPFAFNKRKELKAASCGKIFLMEYLEEYPMLLNHTGMGARLTTYYKKKNATDITHLKIRDEAEKKGKSWQVGAIVGLGDDDESPFLGEIPVGRHQLALETGLYTSPAHPYETPACDFLVTRSNAGSMRIREITGTFVCGQELPLHRIPPPNTRALKNLQERRIHVYVMRTLHTDSERIKRERNEAVLEGRKVTNEIPYISLEQTSKIFKGRPTNMIKMYFKECKLVFFRKYGEDEWYVLSSNARIPSEAELKKMVRCRRYPSILKRYISSHFFCR